MKTVGDEAEAYAREVRQSGKSSTLYYSQPFAKKIPEAPHMDRKPRVLFIGNSLTYYSGGIDRYVVRIQEFRAERYTKAGATLEDLWNEGGAAERIAEGGWAVVVLQDDLPEGSSVVRRVRRQVCREDPRGGRAAAAADGGRTVGSLPTPSTTSPERT